MAGKGLLGELGRLTASRRAQAAAALAVLIGAAAIGVGNPVLVKYVFDNGLFAPRGIDMALLIRLAVVMVAVAVVAGAFGLLSTYLTERLVHGLMFDLRTGLFKQLATAPLEFLRAARMGELNARFTTDLAAVEASLVTAGVDLVAATLLLIATAAAMFVLSVPLAVLTLLLCPVFVWLTRAIAARRRRLAADVQTGLGELGVVVDNALSANGALHERLFGRTSLSVAEFRRISGVLYGKQVRQAMYTARLDAIVTILFAVIPVVVYLGAGTAITAGHPVQAGTLAAFVALQMRFFGPAGQVMHLTTEIAAAAPALERILRYVPDLPAAARPVGRAGSAEVAVEVLSYRYPGQASAALTDVDLSVGPGELVAVVGPSGCGKTTLALLIAGVLHPTSGTVRTNGRVGLVAQRPHLINASVRDNIAYGNPNATTADVMAAAAVAGLHDRILAMPEGYDTEVGQQGAALSGGEGQRLSLARAVLADARTMVFDEATSGLDAATEREVWANLRAGPATRTMIVISHNLDVTRQADRVYVLDGGRVVACGTDEELHETCAAYRCLHGQLSRS